MIQEANLVFTKVLNILASKPATIQDSFHSCQLLLDFFVQVMVFCNADLALFKLTYGNPTQILLSSIAY
jgi:hypothetical protein